MTPKSLQEFKTHARKFANLYDILIESWNGKLEHGNNATYPVTIVVGVLVSNIAFNGSNCVGYSHEKAVQELESNLKTLEAVNNYENKLYMVNYAYNELYNLYEGLRMSEDI